MPKTLFARSLLGFAALILAVMCLLVAYQVGARHIPAIPPYLWTEEVARGFLIWLVMIGAGYGFFTGDHFRMSALLDALPARAGHGVSILIQLVIAVTGILFAISGIEFVERGWSRTSFASGLPLVWVYSALIVGGVLMAAGGAWQAWSLLRSGLAQPDTQSEGGL